MALVQPTSRVFHGAKPLGAMHVGAHKAWEPVAWSPAVLPGLQLWLDAADDASFTFTAGQQVATWGDKSGFARDFNNAASSKPFRTGTMNGRPTVLFNGSTQHIRRLSGNPTLIKPYTLLLVARSTGTGTTQRDVFMTLTDGRVFRSTGGTLAMYQGALLDASPIQWLVGQTHAVVAVFNAANSKLAVDGAAYILGNTGSSGVSASTWAVGSLAGSNAEWWQGDVAEVVVATGEISAADLANWWTYSKTKWGP